MDLFIVILPFHPARPGWRLRFRGSALHRCGYNEDDRFIDQVQGGPVAAVIRPPGHTIVILRNGIRHFQIDDGLFEIVQVFFIAEFRDNDCQ